MLRMHVVFERIAAILLQPRPRDDTAVQRRIFHSFSRSSCWRKPQAKSPTCQAAREPSSRRCSAASWLHTTAGDGDPACPRQRLLA